MNAQTQTQTRISVDLDKSVHRDLKRFVADEDVTISAVVRSMVDDLLRREATDDHRRTVVERARKGHG